MAAHWKSDRRRRMIGSGPDFVNVRRTLRPTTRCAMWLPTFLQRGIHFFGERTEVLAFNNFVLFDRVHRPIIGKRAAVVEEDLLSVRESARAKIVAASI